MLAPPSRSKACSTAPSTVAQLVQLPEGLVGPAPHVPACINDQPCTVLLDSGSQVSIIFEKWYNRYLSDVPLQPLSGLVVWGLSEQSYPYRGYVSVMLRFPKTVAGVEKEIPIIALVCPEAELDQRSVPVIVGTNANIFRTLAQWCREIRGESYLQTLTIHPTCRAAYVRKEKEERSELSPNCFNSCFEGSDLKEDEKGSIIEAMMARREAFSLGEWDLGLAQGVEHHIRLTDETPFRERSDRKSVV